MVMTGPLKWHGGKQYLARRIRALFPPHLHYVEPYAGGLAVLLAGDGEGVSEVVNDINGDLTNFWRVLQDAAQFAAFKRIIDVMPFSEPEWRDADDRRHRLPPDFMTGDRVQWAVDFFVLCRQSLAGRMAAFA